MPTGTTNVSLRESLGDSPRVTVFMALYNRASMVEESVQSILDQSFRDFELLVIDDGSTDGSPEIVEAIDDPRIRLVRQPENIGIPKTRNHGLSLARGEYLAILDSDDWAYPTRLARQVEFLDGNPEIAAVGGWAKRVKADGQLTSPALRPTHSREVRARILFATCFKNPTMMARTRVMREFGYREEFVICQDIDLWGRMSAKYTLANLPEYLIRYRLGGTSHQSDELSARMKKRAAEDQLRDLGIDFDARDLDGHYVLRNTRGFVPDDDFIDWSEQWLLRLLAANRANPCYPEPEFTRAAAERWFRLGLTALKAGQPIRRFLLQRRLSPMLGAVCWRMASTFVAHLAADWRLRRYLRR